jgi:protein O-GlcNAc transferase
VGPDDPAAEGARHFAAGDWRRAAAAYRLAVEREPGNAQHWNRLGFAAKELGDSFEAHRAYARATELAPRSVAALCNAASALRDIGRVEEALALFRRARQMAPDSLDVLSAYVYTLNYSTLAGREDVFREHLETDRLLAGGAATAARPRGPRPARLRVAYLSPDFRLHAVAAFIEPVLRHHDRARFEVLCYYLHPARDETTAALQALADRWLDCARWKAADLAARIAADGVDVLVDLAGHTDWNALPVLALKPAPVIATWLGYLNTTGLRTVDYRITDRHTDPPGETERFHAETLLRLPDSQWCRARPPDAPGVSALPARARGRLRFGSFNRASKLTAETLSLWARVLQEVPGADLLLVDVSEGQRAQVRQALAAGGVAAGRVAFAGRLPLAQFRALHGEVDIALDAHPYSGATTTLDSLWMGVPTLTLTSGAPMSRSTASLLYTLGLAEWIASSPEAYVALAARHAADLGALEALRARLRALLEGSVLMDGARFTRQLEGLYEEMWRGA